MLRPHRLTWGFALSMAVVLTLGAGVVRSQDDDSDGDSIPDGIEQATQRTVVVLPKDSGGDELSIVSSLRNAPDEDQFTVSFSQGKFELDYEKGEGGGSSYTLEIVSLVEWVDANGNDLLEADEVVQSFPLGQIEFADVSITRTKESNTDGGRVYRLSIPSQTGLVTLNLTVAERFMRLPSGRILTPMEVKVDIEVNRPAVPAATNLALELQMETEQEVEYSEITWDELNDFADDDAAMNVTGGSAEAPALAFFSWEKSATANGRNITVSLMTADGDAAGEYDLYLLYFADGQAIDRLVHDPTIGVRSAAFEGIVSRLPPLQADVLLYGGTLVLMAAVVGGTILLANRRRKKRED